MDTVHAQTTTPTPTAALSGDARSKKEEEIRQFTFLYPGWHCQSDGKWIHSDGFRDDTDDVIAKKQVSKLSKRHLIFRGQ